MMGKPFLKLVAIMLALKEMRQSSQQRKIKVVDGVKSAN